MALTRKEQLTILVSLRKATEILERELEPQKLKPRSKKQQAFKGFDNMYGGNKSKLKAVK